MSAQQHLTRLEGTSAAALSTSLMGIFVRFFDLLPAMRDLLQIIALVLSIWFMVAAERARRRFNSHTAEPPKPIDL